ncbi:acyl-CoA dehydrogenase [Rhodanobacter glycinis]|uniref:Acyl-CoA dehydrogenase n=1 Tax=Rhodanobacter glycinis TaxID=582702 RepID=A0A5B9DW73_9GAMM|nr:acyl-CoA dehydrogenase family protein [Rhodanobacter glycinis]QEE23374.1 acyl-CoA dehydrogenase [Rhodanobacter glycinis]
MDFAFTEDQLAFRDAVSRFFMTEAAPEQLREIWETNVGRSSDLRRKIAEQGLTGLSVPEAEGGLALGDIDWALMTQELGYYAIPDSLADTAYVATGLLSGLPAGHPLRAEWLPRVVDGSCRIAVGHPVNPWVADAHLADLLLLSHATPQGCELHAVGRDAVQVTRLPSIDGSRRLWNVAWQPAAATCVLDAAAAQPLWDEALERGALNVSGQLIGLAQRMLDLSVDYAAQRKQFGKPIGSFQAIKHHLADVVTKIEFARPVLYRAAVALARREPGCAVRVAHARLVCADAAWIAARKGIQVHGAMGYTWEVDLQMFMKRAWVLDAAWGDRGFHRARLGAALLDSDDAALGAGTTFATQHQENAHG